MQVDASVRRIATIFTARDEATSELNSAEQAGDDTAESFERVEDSTDRIRQSALRAGAAFAALSGSLALLTRQHGETEQTFARLQVVAGATTDEMDEMRQMAQQVGIDLPIAMGDAATAMEQLAFAGFEAEEAVSAATGVANLAVASGMQMGEAARTTASALRMFGLEARETHQVTATMAAVFSNSATNIQELGQVLEYAGGTAFMAGVSMQELAAATGVMADQGIRGSRAGTALNRTLQNIATGSGQAADALDRLGLSIDDLTDQEGELQDLSVVFGMIGDEMDELDGQAERLAVATELAGTRGARALLPLLENTEELNEKMGDIFRSEIQESIGALSQLTDDELEGAEAALEMEIDGQDITPEELVDHLEDLHEQGVDTTEMTQMLASGLAISEDAAHALALDVQDTSVSAEQLTESIGGATTASEIAASNMNTAAGAAQFMRSSLDAMTFAIFTGAGPAIQWFNEQLGAGINLLNTNERAMKAVGGSLAVLTGITGAATAALAAHWIQLKLTTAAQGMHTSTTAGATAAMWGYNTATRMANSAVWLLTANHRMLAAATWAKVTALAASTKAMFAGATAAGVKTAAIGALTVGLWGAAAGAWALVTALGPIGWAVILLTAGLVGLVGVMRTDFLGAGDRAAAVLDRIGHGAAVLGAILRELGGIFFELGRIGVTALAMLPIGLAAAILDPQAAYEAGAGFISSLVSGLRDSAPDVTGTVSDIASSARDYLPFSDAKAGPLSDITGSGAGFIQALTGGMQGESGAVGDTLSSLFAATPLGQVTGGLLDGGAAAVAGGGGGTGKIEVNFQQELNFGDVDDVEGTVEQATSGAEGGVDTLLKKIRREVSTE